MKIITGICVRKKYQLLLTKNRLTQRTNPQRNSTTNDKFYVLLKDFQNNAQFCLPGRSMAQLRTKSDPDGGGRWGSANLIDELRTIGCTKFGPRAWKQIKAAIAAAK